MINNVEKPPKYTLVSLRSFPSLEPLSCIPVSTKMLGEPLRRDILWRAVVYENDNRRVGASNPPGRSENGYSRHKLRPQKGSGKARVGDANSPTRHKGGRALARDAPNDYSTELPSKIYASAFNIALSQQYRAGNLYVIGGDRNVNKPDLSVLDIPEIREEDGQKNKLASVTLKNFLNKHNLEGKRLLFITSDTRNGLLKYTDYFKNKIDVINMQGVEINDILKANRVFIEFDALKYFAETFKK